MTISRAFWGILFIFLGFLILAVNFSALNLDFNNLGQYWPALIIILGFAMLFTKFSRSRDQYSSKEFKAEYSTTIKTAALNIQGGAGSIRIGLVTENLMLAKTECTKGNFIKSGTDEFVQLKLKLENTAIFLDNCNCISKADIALSEKPNWKMDFELGAASTDLDLTKFKIEDIKMDVGAAKINVKLGALADNLNFRLNSGASQIVIAVPEEVGCEIVLDDAISKKDIFGFNQISSNHYKTNNYDNTDKKILISIDSGVSSIDIRRYSNKIQPEISGIHR